MWVSQFEYSSLYQISSEYSSNIKIIESTRFQKEKTSEFTFCSRRTHSMTKKAVAMLSMMCNITSTSSCSLIASMRKIPEQKENSSFAFCLGFSKSSLFRIIPESNQILKKSTQVCTIVSLDVASPCVSNVALTGGDENHQNGDEGK